MSNDLVPIIRDLIAHKHEEEWFEFKQNWFEPHALGEYISALSNAAALQGRKFSYFVWGIENETHKILGTNFDFHQDVKKEPLIHYLSRQTDPDIGFWFQELLLDSKHIVVLVIPAAVKTPTAFDDVRYIRIGSSKEKLMRYPEHESQLFYILRHGFPTIENMAAEYQDLTFNKLLVYYEAKGLQLNKRTFRKNLGLLTSEGKYNVLAQLLSDDSRIPIRFGLFSGNTKTSMLYSVREFGNTCLLYSLDDVLRYGDVLNIPQADERNRIVERKEVMLFNQEAYREAVINAFVHNRWLDGNAPMFNAFRDRVEILSRGSLPPNQTIEGFYAGESVPVNPALSRIFIQLHITEHTGRGVPKITDVYGETAVRFNENNIIVTIPLNWLNVQDQENNVQDGVKNLQVTTQVASENVQDQRVNTPDEVLGPPDITLDEGLNTPDITLDEGNDYPYLFNKIGEIEKKILGFCVVPRNILEIAVYLGYKEKKTVRKYLFPLIEIGRIAMTMPDKPTSKYQKYVTIK